jgi:RimJ/RimL family protein N-acetyltransferase
MIEFRPIDLARDLELCVEFRRDSYQSSFTDPTEWKKYWNEAEYRNWIFNHSKKFPEGVFHLFVDSKIVGQLEFAYFGKGGHVNLYYLHPDYRGKGYGDLLQEKVISVLKEKGCKTATLRVSPQNIRAIRFYLKHGWTDCGPDKNYDYVHLFQINL